MRAAILATMAGVMACAGTSAARADVLYTMVVDTVGYVGAPQYPKAPPVAPSVSFTVSDGGASFEEAGGEPGQSPTITNAIGYATILINDEPITPFFMLSGSYIEFSASDSDVDIEFFGISTDLELNEGAGVYGSDGPCNGGFDTCAFTYHFIETALPLPEPASWLLFGVGLFGLSLVRRALI